MLRGPVSWRAWAPSSVLQVCLQCWQSSHLPLKIALTVRMTSSFSLGQDIPFSIWELKFVSIGHKLLSIGNSVCDSSEKSWLFEQFLVAHFEGKCGLWKYAFPGKLSDEKRWWKPNPQSAALQILTCPVRRHAMEALSSYPRQHLFPGPLFQREDDQNWFIIFPYNSCLGFYWEQRGKTGKNILSYSLSPSFLGKPEQAVRSPLPPRNKQTNL